MSDIWNEFEKIAVEQGLVEADQDLVKNAKEDDPNRPYKAPDPAKMPVRYDSIADDAIALLYGIQPESIYDDKKTIIENAHPETAVAMRAYDAMNAVWENEHQRHDMMAYIALKQPNGHLIQRRYVAAKQDLVNALVRSAFLLENRDEEQLVSLADSCAERLVEGRSEDPKGLKKEAVAVAAVAAVGAAATVLGGAYWLMYGAQSATNVWQNSQKVLEALQPLSNQKYAKGIRENVTKIMRMAQQIYASRNKLTQVQNVDTAIQAAQSPKHVAMMNALEGRIKQYIAQLQKVQAAIPTWISKIKLAHSTEMKNESDVWTKLRGATDPFFWSPDEILIDRLGGQKNWIGQGSTGGLMEAISKDIQLMNGMIQAAQQQVQQAMPQNLWTPPPGAQPAPQVAGQIPMGPAPTPGPGPAMGPAPQVQQPPRGNLPPPVPPPNPTQPGGAAKPAPGGFGDLPDW